MKTILFIFFCFLYVSPFCQSSSVSSIYSEAKTLIKIIEDLNYEVVHAEFDVLSDSDNLEIARRIFSNEYTYMVVAFGGEGIEKLQVSIKDGNQEVANSEDNEQMLREMITDPDMVKKIAMAKFTPKESKLRRIFVEGSDFERGYRAGRYLMFVAHTLDDNSKEDKVTRLTTVKRRDFVWKYEKDDIEWGRTSFTTRHFEFDSNEGILLLKSKAEKAINTFVVEEMLKNDDDIMSFKLIDRLDEDWIFEISKKSKPNAIFLYQENTKGIYEGARYEIKE